MSCYFAVIFFLQHVLYIYHLRRGSIGSNLWIKIYVYPTLLIPNLWDYTRYVVCSYKNCSRYYHFQKKKIRAALDIQTAVQGKYLRMSQCGGFTGFAN